MVSFKIEHFYGSQEKHDLQLSRLILDTQDLYEKDALENGWLHCKEWYSCRSVRIDTSKYKIKHTNHAIDILHHTDDTVKHIVKKIYQEYLDYKKFDKEYDIFVDLNRTNWLILKDEGEPIAFTKFNRYDGGVESQFTAWNYHKPKMSIGKIIVDYEVAFAKSLGYNYLYIGQGYETGSSYKAEFKGFEWWTGSEWSTDKEKYKELCARDSSINTLDDLTKVFNNATCI
jgi:arginyl-tRNA--protein-N-Asp/Glu arginylyltransferase